MTRTETVKKIGTNINTLDIKGGAFRSFREFRAGRTKLRPMSEKKNNLAGCFVNGKFLRSELRIGLTMMGFQVNKKIALKG